MLANARMLGMATAIDAPRLLAVGAVVDVLLAAYSVGFAVVGAVVGEYLGSAGDSAI